MSMLVKLSPEDEWIRYKEFWLDPQTGYAYLSKTTVHRIVARFKFWVELPKHLDVHHINGDRLDNRRENLDLVTRSENVHRAVTVRGTTGYRKVFWDKKLNKYVVRVQIKRKPIHIGTYNNPVEAAYWADVWTVRLLPDYAQLNFPDNINFYIEEAKNLITTLPWQRSC